MLVTGTTSGGAYKDRNHYFVTGFFLWFTWALLSPLTFPYCISKEKSQKRTTGFTHFQAFSLSNKVTAEQQAALLAISNRSISTRVAWWCLYSKKVPGSVPEERGTENDWQFLTNLNIKSKQTSKRDLMAVIHVLLCKLDLYQGSLYCKHLATIIKLTSFKRCITMLVTICYIHWFHAFSKFMSVNLCTWVKTLKLFDFYRRICSRNFTFTWVMALCHFYSLWPQVFALSGCLWVLHHVIIITTIWTNPKINPDHQVGTFMFHSKDFFFFFF